MNDYLGEHARLLIGSYRKITGRDLLPAETPRHNVGPALFEAPFVGVSHASAADPVFNYGNRAALDLFEMTWDRFTSLPSRLSAEPMHRDERARLLDTVARHGFIDDYSGIRISSTGRRFTIERATVWTILGGDGSVLGQAATFSQWSPIP